MEKLNEIKDLYEKGYRCIKTDESSPNMTVYLKNFEVEMSKELSITNASEKNAVNEFLASQKRFK